MAELSTKLIRDYFEGNWLGKVYVNGELDHELELTWTEESGKFSVPHINFEVWLITNTGEKEEKSNRAIVTWHSDNRTWVTLWYNDSGGYSELVWTSHEEVNGIPVLYGYLRERKAEGELPTEYIAMCELKDKDNFKYTILSYRKGILEMIAKRIDTAVDDEYEFAEKQLLHE